MKAFYWIKSSCGVVLGLCDSDLWQQMVMLLFYLTCESILLNWFSCNVVLDLCHIDLWQQMAMLLFYVTSESILLN